MYKKISYYLSLIVVTLMLGTCIFNCFTYSTFNSDRVLADIEELSSSAYSGRLPGTPENEKAANFIESKFKENGLVPLNETYKENFKLKCPLKTNSEPYLNISKDGEIVKTLEYGVDFKEDGVNFNENTFTFNFSNVVKITTFVIQVQTPEGNFALFNPDNSDLSFRSSFSEDFRLDCLIMITSKAYGEIIQSLNNNCAITIHVPFKNEEKEISNVVGVLEGKDDSLSPLVLTAHFDHLGKDGADTIYSGALDNASGISFLLEVQKNLSSLGKPDRDIIFVALNAEEYGLKGSEVFARNNLEKLKNAEVINFDMIGSDNYPITIMMPSCMENKDCNLYNNILDICKDKKIETKPEYKDSSDHASFGNLGLNAITLSHSDMRFIHTPNDKSDNISTDAIDSVYSVVYEKVVPASYSNVLLLYHNKYMLLGLTIIFVGFITIPLYKKVKNHNE